MKAKVKEVKIPVIRNMRYGQPEGINFAGTAYSQPTEPEGYIYENVLACPVCDTRLIKSILNNMKLYCPSCVTHDIDYD